MFSVALSLALAALAHTLPVPTVVSGAATAVLFAPGARRESIQAAVLDPRNSDQTAIEFIRLVLAAEATPAPRREIIDKRTDEE